MAVGACVADTMIQSMSGRYASYWNAFLFILWQQWQRKGLKKLNFFTVAIAVRM